MLSNRYKNAILFSEEEGAKKRVWKRAPSPGYTALVSVCVVCLFVLFLSGSVIQFNSIYILAAGSDLLMTVRPVIFDVKPIKWHFTT